MAYGAGEMAGGVLGPSPFTKARALGVPFKAALEGGLGSLGASEGETVQENLADIGRGAGFSAMMSRMGDIIKFPKKKRKSKAKEIASDIPPPDNVTPMMKKNVRDSVEKLDKLIAQLKSLPAETKPDRPKTASDKLFELDRELRGTKTNDVPDITPVKPMEQGQKVQNLAEIKHKGAIKLQREILQENKDTKALKAIDAAEKNGSNEPYVGFGSLNNIVHKDKKFYKKKNENTTISELPIRNYKPDGLLGREVKAGGPDPFAWLDRNYNVGKKALEAHADKPLTINTRSDLIATNDYSRLLKKNHKVIFHVGNGNPQLNRIAAPGSPSLSRILTAAENLKSQGVDVSIDFDDLPVAKQYKALSDPEVVERLNAAGIPYKISKIPVTKEFAEYFQKATGFPVLRDVSNEMVEKVVKKKKRSKKIIKE